MNSLRHSNTINFPIKPSRWHRCVGVLIVLATCSPMGALAATDQASEGYPTLSRKRVGLGIHGFNYTDVVIEWFSINSNGGGNIAVSSPTSGGGGTTCCFSWRPGTISSIPVKIEWMRMVNHKERWCTKTVMVNGPYPEKPFAIAVHFMPNGDIIPEITEGFPTVKLKLERFDPGHRKERGNITHDEQKGECRYEH